MSTRYEFKQKSLAVLHHCHLCFGRRFLLNSACELIVMFETETSPWPLQDTLSSLSLLLSLILLQSNPVTIFVSQLIEELNEIVKMPIFAQFLCNLRCLWLEIWIYWIIEVLNIDCILKNN